MPTKRRRFAITETDDVKSALAAGEQRWPGLASRPGELLRRLVIEGGRALQREDGQATARRTADIKATKGALAGVYGPDYLTELRKDWPA